MLMWSLKYYLSDHKCPFNIICFLQINVLLLTGNFLADFALLCSYKVDKLSTLGGSALDLFSVCKQGSNDALNPG